ncbi:hypothetical protein ABK040_003037 [Willaertia magna]
MPKEVNRNHSLKQFIINHSSSTHHHHNNSNSNSVDSFQISPKSDSLMVDSSENNLSMNSNGSNNNDNDKSPQFHPIACVNCRKLHKRCDKALPYCSGCIQRGVICEYRDPKPRNRRKINLLQVSTTNQHPSSSSSSSSPLTEKNPSNVNNNRLILRNTSKLSISSIIDFYYKTISLGYPIIEREELVKYITRDYNDENLTHEERVIMALYYSIQAIVEQRFGYLEDAELSAKISRNLLKEIFDEHSDLYVAGTFYYLSLFEAANGRYKNSRNYLTNVNFYLDELEGDNRTKQQESLYRIKSLSALTSIIDVDCFAFIRNLPNLFETAVGKHLPQEVIQILQQEPTQQNVDDYIHVMSLILNTLNTIAKRNLPKEVFALNNLNNTFFENGLKIAVLSKVGIGKELMEECALKITLATEDPSFPYLSSESVVPLISMACQVHLQKLNEIENTKRIISNFNTGFYHYEIIKKDYRAFLLLSKRFGKVSLHYDNVLKELESSVNRYNEMIQNNQDNTIKFFMEIMNNTKTNNTTIQPSYQNTEEITSNNNPPYFMPTINEGTDSIKGVSLLTNGEENALDSTFSFLEDFTSVSSPYLNNISSPTNNENVDTGFASLNDSNSWNDWIFKWSKQ